MDSSVCIWLKHRLCISAWIWQFHACLYALWCVCSYLFDSDVCLPILLFPCCFVAFQFYLVVFDVFWYVYDELLQGLLCSYHFCTFVANMCSVQLRIANLSSPRTSSNLLEPSSNLLEPSSNLLEPFSNLLEPSLEPPRTTSNLPRTLVASMVLTAHVLHFLLHLGMFCHFGANFVRFRIISAFHKGFCSFSFFSLICVVLCTCLFCFRCLHHFVPFLFGIELF